MTFRVLAMVLLATLNSAHAHTPDIPRAADGHPDLGGKWDGTWSINIEANAPNEKLDLTEDEVAAQLAMRRKRMAGIAFPIDPLAAGVAERPNPQVGGKLRSRMVISPADGRIPYTEAGKQTVAGWRKSNVSGPGPGPRDNPEDRTLPERCIALNGHPPFMYPHEPGGLREFVQTPGYVLIHSETGSDTRIIRMNAAHTPAAVRTRLGDSIGRWEGDTLVVETTNFPAAGMLIDLISQPPLQYGPDSRVVERFKPLSATEMIYQFTIEDPAIYAAPWVAEYPMMRSSAVAHEYACHESNHGLANILLGARAEEQRAANTGKH